MVRFFLRIPCVLLRVEIRVNDGFWGVYVWIIGGLIDLMSGFCCYASVLVIWVINWVISG